MPAEYSIDPARELVTIRLRGLVRGDEGFAVREQIVVDPAYRANFDELIDATEATGFDVSGATVRAAAEIPALANDVRRAMVAGTDESYGIFRMFQSASGRPGVRVFRSRTEAEEWLAEDPDGPGATSLRAEAP